VACRIVGRAALSPGDELIGPAIVEEPDSTTLIAPGDVVRVGPTGILEIDLEASA
jgi:N-methylhydantoinase A/oxoprolinase/acetone carboxylase beta subunit